MLTFAEAARHIGHADPYDVTEHLRRAVSGCADARLK
jgi:hypothetical protein